MSCKIGIGITTTPNRNILDLRRWDELLPQDCDFIVYEDADYKGVAHAKNQLLAQLDHCDHIFLFDDDCYPIAKNWWLPYVEHPEPHLMYQFKLPDKPPTDMKVLYEDDQTVSYSHTRGAMIYIEKIVLDTIGGFDETYGLYGFEHPDFTNRIHNAGLTTFRSMDVPNSSELLYCLDQDSNVQSSLSKAERNLSIMRNFRYYKANMKSNQYKPYK